MLVNFRPFAPKRRIPRNFSSKRAVLTASLSAVAAFTACGASPKAANLSPTNSETLAVSAQLPNATEGSSYTGSVTASGGTSPYNFAVTPAQLFGRDPSGRLRRPLPRRIRRRVETRVRTCRLLADGRSTDKGRRILSTALLLRATGFHSR